MTYIFPHHFSSWEDNSVSSFIKTTRLAWRQNFIVTMTAGRVIYNQSYQLVYYIWHWYFRHMTLEEYLKLITWLYVFADNYKQHQMERFSLFDLRTTKLTRWRNMQRRYRFWSYFLEICLLHFTPSEDEASACIFLHLFSSSEDSTSACIFLHH